MEIFLFFFLRRAVFPLFNQRSLTGDVFGEKAKEEDFGIPLVVGECSESFYAFNWE